MSNHFSRFGEMILLIIQHQALINLCSCWWNSALNADVISVLNRHADLTREPAEMITVCQLLSYCCACRPEPQLSHIQRERERGGEGGIERREIYSHVHGCDRLGAPSPPYPHLVSVVLLTGKLCWMNLFVCLCLSVLLSKVWVNLWKCFWCEILGGHVTLILFYTSFWTCITSFHTSKMIFSCFVDVSLDHVTMDLELWGESYFKINWVTVMLFDNGTVVPINVKAALCRISVFVKLWPLESLWSTCTVVNSTHAEMSLHSRPDPLPLYTGTCSVGWKL